MAEALLNHLAGDRFEAESAGLEPGTLNPFAVEAMKNMNIDISHKKTQSVFDVYRSGRSYSYVISVCDEASGERCPIFPGVTQRIHWSFSDPSSVEGTDEEKTDQTIVIRDQISRRIESWVKEIN
jgi:arsenate reductase